MCHGPLRSEAIIRAPPVEYLNMANEKKPWAGRFEEATDEFVEAFTASVDFDHVLAQQDLRGSTAHARMLSKAGVLTTEEFNAIQAGLVRIGEQIEAGNFAWSVALEDVHMNIEHALTEAIGDVGKKLHTGRSRNDQVATDLRLFVRDAIDSIATQLTRLQHGLLNLAEREADTVMPGFTHLQVAQPITFGHHLLAWFEQSQRDYSRFMDCRARLNESPLGAAALAGTTYPIDRAMTAAELSFDRPMANSLDAVSDRDFAIEFTAAASLLMQHYSRWSEELVLWSSSAFGFISLPDRFCTGSSIMPQKKNPDVPELIRGKTGRVFGHLTGLLTLMKGQPLAYNKDNQEDKEPVFDAITTVLNSTIALADMIPEIEPKAARMREAASQGYPTATDLADYLVRREVPFRDAHEVVGRLVAMAIEAEVDLAELALEDMRSVSGAIEADVFDVLTLEGSVAARDHIGGTAPARVREAVTVARAALAAR